MQKTPQPPNGKYKCVYYRKNHEAPYTQSRIPYDDYLQTDVWRELRNKRLALDNYQCQKCRTAINVQVHHIRYPDVWGMENVRDDLITLCESCHKKIHEYDHTNDDVPFV